MLREFLTQFRFFLRGRQPDRLDDELAYHIQQATERGIAEGLDASEARRQAVLEFGGLDRTREDAFRQHPGWFLSVLLQDHHPDWYRLGTGSCILALALRAEQALRSELTRPG